MGLRTDFNFKKDGPGPNAYKYEVNAVRPGVPSYSMCVFQSYHSYSFTKLPIFICTCISGDYKQRF